MTIIHKYVSRKVLAAAVVSVLISLFSCTSTKKVTYFSGLQNDTLNSVNVVPDPVIQNNDLLSISVGSLNPEASVIFNANYPRSAQDPSGNTASAYLVDAYGYIQFPVLGNIKVAGMNKYKLKELITGRLIENKLLVDPVVNIRYLNFKVTVLGEVNKPSVLSVPSEKISLLEALGLAGDMTLFGKRENVLLIREENGKKISRRINLNTQELFESGFYYLKPNDVVYVETTKAKVTNSGKAIWVPAVISGLSFVAIIAGQVIK
ncbi:MAG: polysaccharide biosynthesis/export family protein [Chitinophagaceae bacterium]|nr:polysaccharide biosynthesis/export family protein [Chitinophagaceae bacterium]